MLNIELLQNFLTIDNTDLSLIQKTQNYINQEINKTIKQKIVMRVPYDKKLVKQYAIRKTRIAALYCYQKSHIFDLKTIDVIYVL